MKKNILILVGAILGITNSAEAITLPDSVAAFFQSASVTEMGTITGSNEDVTTFIDYFKNNWQNIVNNFNEIAPTKVKKNVLISAAENLEPTAYLSYLSSMLDKYQENKVERDSIKRILSPGAKKYGFLEYNYTNASVIALCNRVKTVFPDDIELKERMKDILSGEQKKQTAAALGMENRPAPETLPAQ